MSTSISAKRAIATTFNVRIVKKRRIQFEEKFEMKNAKFGEQVRNFMSQIALSKSISTARDLDLCQREYGRKRITERVESLTGIPEPDFEYYDDWLYEIEFTSNCTIQVWNGDFSECYPSQKVLELQDKQSMDCCPNRYCLYYRGHKFTRVYRKNEWID